ncbi:T9SS type A sorting domain-containing protein [Saprospira grandis]|uniref:T9SS type A sorting domain-containing protein n=1 Tax=Saprospira grandis TaxID=1008 RepID=UPI0022DE0717|nr:T9SS type A sorting domain-containing protein [Saprospira grandis]WBM74458.1 T9SS type A sorting domain-containing protein [Saprospira grandis]
MREMNLFVLFMILLLPLQAQVDLGGDQPLCPGSSLTLDAGNSGSSYLWSTGATGQMITVSNPGIYWVDVDAGSGPVRDSIELLAVTPLSGPTYLSDTTVCIGNSLLFLGDPSAAYQFWSSPLGGILGEGDSLSMLLQQEDSLYWNAYASSLQYNRGEQQRGTTSQSGFYATGNYRGIRFDAKKSFVLRSVEVGFDGSFTGQISLLDASGQSLATYTVQTVGPGVFVLPLNFSVPQANGLELRLTGSGGQSYMEYPYSNWASHDYEELKLVEGTPYSVVYSSFYNWQIERFACPEQQGVALGSLYTPSTDFPEDTLSCGSSVFLDASNSGPTIYNWSNGATTSSILVGSTQQVSLSMTDSSGSCSFTDSIYVEVLQPQGLYTNFTDSTACLGQTLILEAYNAANTTFWRRQADDSLLAIGNNYALTVRGADSLYAQSFGGYEILSRGEEQRGTTSQANFYNLGNYRGIVFNALTDFYLESVDIDLNGGFLGEIQLRSPSGQILLTQSINTANAGSHTLVLNFTVPAGNGMELRLVGAGGQMYMEYPYSNWSSLQYPELEFVTGTPYGTVYAGFYNWKIRDFKCEERALVHWDAAYTPLVDFPTDTISCGANVLLDASNLGPTMYSWSDSSQQPQLLVSNSGPYTIDLVDSTGTCASRDSIYVNIVAPLGASSSLNDSSICVGQEISFLAQSAGSHRFWRDFNGQLLAATDSLSLLVQQTDSFYLQAFGAYALNTRGETQRNTTTQAGYYNVGNYRGLRFNALTDFYLESVEIDFNAPFSGSVQLLDASEQILATATVNATAAGTLLQTLNFVVPAANDLELRLVGTGGQVFVEFPYSNWSSLQYADLEILGGTPFSTVYNCFYNWQLREYFCEERDTVNIDALTTPTFDFPQDSLVCGQQVTLDMSYLSAGSYNWSNGSSSPSIQLTQSQNIELSAAIGSCSYQDSMQLYIVDTVAFQLNDTVSCGGDLTLAANGDSSGIYLWWDAAQAGQLLHQGQNYTTTLYDSSQFFVEAYAKFPEITTVGFTQNNNTTQGDYFILPSDRRGIRFDVAEDIYLETVDFYANGLVNGRVLILDPNGQSIHEQFYNFNHFGALTIDINVFLRQGTGYQILFEKYAGTGALYADYPTAYPLDYGAIQMQEGVPFTQVYYYFYNWKLSELSCPSQRQAMNVDVLPTINTNWGRDSTACGNSLTLDLSYPNASYLWSDGSVTPTITLSQSDTVWVQAQIGSCTTEDTLIIYLTNPPSFNQLPNDTTVCASGIDIFASSTGYTQIWYADSIGQQILGYGDSLHLTVADSQTIWLEGVDFMHSSQFYGWQEFPTLNGSYEEIGNSFYPERGLFFDAQEPLLIDQFSVFADSSAEVEIVLLDRFGYSLYRQNYNLQLGENIISPHWFVPQANGYRLTIRMIWGKGIYTINSFSYPLTTTALTIQSGYPLALGTSYPAFFRWEISRLACATNRIPIQVNVPPKPIISMPSDTAICGSANNLTLSATTTNPNYQYQWSMGDTSNQVHLNQAGSYSVTVTNMGLCESRKSFDLQLLSPPLPYFASDSSICSSRTLDMLAPPNNGILQWQNSQSVAFLGAPYTAYIDSSQSFIIQNQAKAYTRLGEQMAPNPQNLNQYQPFVLPNLFDVAQPMLLDSVAVYAATAPTTVELVLRDSSSQELARKSFTIQQAQTKVFLPANFFIPTGNGYRLELVGLNSDFLIQQNLSYPISSNAQLATLTGTSLPGLSYSPFFDWHFGYGMSGCAANQTDSFSVNVRLPSVLADSLFSCDTTVLDASFAQAQSYHWNTGETTASIIADTTGLYYLSMDAGNGCQTNDSIFFYLPEPLELPADGPLCTDELSSNYTDNMAQSFSWSTGETTSQIIPPSPGNYSLSLLDNFGCQLSDSIFISQLASPPVVNIGSLLPICDNRLLDAGFGNQGYSYSWSTGDTTQTVLASSAGVYEVTVTAPTGCSGQDSVILYQDSLPTANFSYTVSGTSVSFSNLSVNQTSQVWYFGDSTATSFGSPFHFYPDTGCYEVRLYAYNDCGSDTIIQALPLGVDPATCQLGTATLSLVQVYQELQLFPNPSSGQLNVQLKAAPLSDGELRIYNLSGQLLKRTNWPAGQQLQALQLDDWPNGLYLLELHLQGESWRKRFVLTH